MALYFSFSNLDTYERELQYCNWLLEEGAKLDAFSNQLNISAAHHVASGFGKFGREPRSKKDLDNLSPESKRLCSVVCNVQVFCRLPCACGSGDGCLPLNILLAEAN